MVIALITLSDFKIFFIRLMMYATQSSLYASAAIPNTLSTVSNSTCQIKFLLTQGVTLTAIKCDAFHIYSS